MDVAFRSELLTTFGWAPCGLDWSLELAALVE